MASRVLEFPPLTLNLADVPQAPGKRVLAAMLTMADEALALLHHHARKRGQPLAAVGKLRGTGRGVHFRDLTAELELTFPITLQAPFEASMKVAGAAWDSAKILGNNQGALAKLRWEAGADDLPMHAHEHSDRLIIVHQGRGFFHVSDQSVEEFDGADVRSIPARERDVFLFTRGVVHTFSTLDEPMTLLSCQLPFLPFDDPRQYRLPAHRWIARDNPEQCPPQVGLDAAWTILTLGR